MNAMKNTHMEARIQELIDGLDKTAPAGEVPPSDIIRDAPGLIALFEDGFAGLKDLVSVYKFPEPCLEIHFFKHVKPRLFSKLIYYRKIYQLELARPVSSFHAVRSHLRQELDHLHAYFAKNAEFVKYYRSGATHLDEHYFLRDRRQAAVNLECFYFERDPRFSTHYDFKVSKLLANDMLTAHLNRLLAKTDKEEASAKSSGLPESKEKWTDKKIYAAELVYAINAAESVSSGDCDIKTLALLFGRAFNVELGDVYRMFLEIRGRKGERAVYLKRLIDALNKRMDEADGQ